MKLIKKISIFLALHAYAPLQATNNKPTTIQDAALSLYKNHNNQAGIDMVLNHEFPLHYAAENNCPFMAQHLLEHGADKEAKDLGRFTPLHLAAMTNSLAVAKLLLRYGANKDAMGVLRITPLSIAASNDSLEVAKLLLKHGADKDAESLLQFPHCWGGAFTHRLTKLLLEYGTPCDTRLRPTPKVQEAAQAIREKHTRYLNPTRYMAEREFKRNDRDISQMEKALQIQAANPWIFEQ